MAMGIPARIFATLLRIAPGRTRATGVKGKEEPALHGTSKGTKGIKRRPYKRALKQELFHPPLRSEVPASMMQNCPRLASKLRKWKEAKSD